MKKTSFIYLLLLIALGLSSCQQEKTFKVLQFNIWQEGAVVKGGFDAIADEIVRSNADFVTLSEVRNYHHPFLRPDRGSVAAKRTNVLFFLHRGFRSVKPLPDHG